MLLGYPIRFHINRCTVYLRVNFMYDNINMRQWIFQMEYVIVLCANFCYAPFFLFKCSNFNVFSMQVIIEITVLISSSFFFLYK